jgi:ABC-type transport system involved in multi-copper enzyme maturation permease subunit
VRVSSRRVRAIVRKELREYRHNGFIIWTMAIFPLIFLIQPLVVVFALPASASAELSHGHLLLYMLGIPAIVPAAVAAYAVVGERQQGTLEPVLTTPVRREEFLLGKALAALVPSVAIAYAVYAWFLTCVALFAQPAVASALLQAPDLLAQLLSHRSWPAGRSGSASRSLPDPATSGLRSSSASSRVSRRPWWRRSSRSM